MKEPDYITKERAYENQVAARYNRDYHEPPIMQYHSESFVQYIARFYKPGDRILDLGCGSASLWNHMQRLLPNPGSMVGVDLSDGMVAEAQRLYPSGDFRVGSFFSIPADAGEFDLVIVSSAFHHIPDETLPDALREIHRVMDEHGKIIGREPLCVGRVGDRGGWLAGALMTLRHLAYRLTNTREYPEPDPGPAHHAYDPEAFIQIINTVLTVTDLEFRNPVSLFVARVHEPVVTSIAKYLDESIGHKEGQEIHYVAHKNYSTAADVQRMIRNTMVENKIEDIPAFLALVEAAAARIEQELKR